MPKSRCFIVLLTAASAGCSAVTGTDDAGQPVQTASAVVLTTDFSGVSGLIPFTFTNRLRFHVYIPNCRGDFGLALERETGDGWTAAWSPPLRACLSPPVVLAPGEELVDTVFVFGGHHDSNAYPQFDRPDPSGTYRLVLRDVLSSYDDDSHPFGDQIAERHRVSNRFSITVADRP